MNQIALPETPSNGGFPEPPASMPVRVVAARHEACGGTTNIRLPASLGADAVRRVHCAGCGAAFRPELVQELSLDPGVVPLEKPSLAKLPKLPKVDPRSRLWRVASLPIMAALVIAALFLIQGGDEPTPSAVSTEGEVEAPEAPAGQAGGAGDSAQGGKPIGKVAKKAQVVSGSNYALALPAGWQRVKPPAGATFMAVEKDGGADATLWIDNNPDLDFPTFVAQSMSQLEALGGSASIVERIPGPTPESTTVRIAAEAPPGEPTLEATLRVAGPYRYYLATTLFPDASPEAAEGVELVVGSFVPEVGGAK